MKRENQKFLEQVNINHMWELFLKFNQKPNIQRLISSCNDLIQMACQKTAGQKSGSGKKYHTKDLDWGENFEMTLQSIVMDCIALEKHGILGEIENG